MKKTKTIKELLSLYAQLNKTSYSELAKDWGFNEKTPETNLVVAQINRGLKLEMQIEGNMVEGLGSNNTRIRLTCHNTILRAMLYRSFKGKSMLLKDWVAAWCILTDTSWSNLEIDGIVRNTLKNTLLGENVTVKSLEAIGAYFSSTNITIDASMVLALDSMNLKFKKVANDRFLGAFIAKSWVQ
jgi:hypothetical protein